MLTLLAARYALEAPTVDSSGSAAAVQVALIVALSPIVGVIVNELIRRLRTRKDPTVPRVDDGILAPVQEVPAAEYAAQLDLVADLDERLRVQDHGHRLAIDGVRQELRGVRDELDRTRRELVAELERRVRAETLLEATRRGTT